MNHSMLGTTVKFNDNLYKDGVIKIKAGIEYPVKYYRRDKENPEKIYTTVCTEDPNLSIEIIDQIDRSDQHIDFYECACCGREFSDVIQKTFIYCPECIDYRIDNVNSIENSFSNNFIQ